MPTVRYLDKHHRPLPDNAPAEKIAFSVYEIHIKPNMRYQPHPAFARDAKASWNTTILRRDDLREYPCAE